MKLLRALAGEGDPAIARAFHALLAICFVIAWLSLGAQLDVLMGSRGLLPARDLADDKALAALPFTELPTLVTRFPSDAALHTGVWIGAGLALLALFGVAPRALLALSTLLYLSYAIAGRTFFSFQWDNLLLECGLVAALLPRDRRAPVAHLALKILVFKLYWESGLAKWQSPLGDWQDGSAMTYYYETAPIPGPLAHAAHALPASWHRIESWFTLFFELVLPFAIVGPRRARLTAALVFTVFQVVNIATANYGFFSYLSLALHVGLLDARDLPRFARGAPKAPSGRPTLLPLRRAAEASALIAYAAASLVTGLGHFSKDPSLATELAPMRVWLSRFRLVNTYHLFAAITRERVEPAIEVSDGGGFIEMPLRHKPGDPNEAPHLVAPHQPRVDFQLWFYGLSYKRGVPPYVAALLDRICHEPAVVGGLFRSPLPVAPAAARLAFYRYHFTTPKERAETGAYWTRVRVAETRALVCR